MNLSVFGSIVPIDVVSINVQVPLAGTSSGLGFGYNVT